MGPKQKPVIVAQADTVNNEISQIDSTDTCSSKKFISKKRIEQQKLKNVPALFSAQKRAGFHQDRLWDQGTCIS